jgi:hypothetical protein
MPDATSLISEEPTGEETIDDLVGDYVGIRDALNDARKNFKAFEARCKEDMEKLEARLLEQSRKLGVKSFKTDHGTAFRTEKDFARVAGPEGWARLTEYMRKTGDFGLVEKRVAKLHFKEIMSELGIAPQDIGVEYVIEEVIQVRRS